VTKDEIIQMTVHAMDLDKGSFTTKDHGVHNMRKELEQNFATRWPEWFVDLYGDPSETCLSHGFEHRDGWFDLVW
jgi:hypothetical protein